MKTLPRFARTLSSIALASAAAFALLPQQAAAAHGGGGWHGGGHFRGGHFSHGGFWPGPFWGGVGLGLGIGAIGYYDGYYAPYYGSYYYDAPLVVAPVYGGDAVTTIRPAQPVPQAPSAPEPIFYPKNGQSAEATEADRRDCNRWATTQRGAMADAQIFQRATIACMEGRGYTVR